MAKRQKKEAQGTGISPLQEQLTGLARLLARHAAQDHFDEQTQKHDEQRPLDGASSNRAE